MAVNYPLLNVTQAEVERVLSFPRTVQEGTALRERAATNLQNTIQQIINTHEENRTYENTILAYHRTMKQFDGVERLFRSERLIPDEAPEKKELIDRCVAIKSEIFANSQLIDVFLCFAEKFELSDVQATGLKKMLCSMVHAPIEYAERLNSIKQILDQRVCTSFEYNPGNCDSKVITERNFSYLNVNLCQMMTTTTMICGGVLPWEPRIDGIAERIKTLNPDIVFLQEAYDEEAIAKLRHLLSDHYAHFYDNIPTQLFGFSQESLLPSSGLASISKFKLDIHFEPYKELTDESAITPYDRLKLFAYDRNYGSLHCNVMNHNQVIAHIASTHLCPFFADIRGKQMEQVIDAFQLFAISHPDVPLILCGDLNIEAGDLNEKGEQLIEQHFIDNYDRTQGPTWFDYGPYWLKKWHPSLGSFPQVQNWLVDRSLIWKTWACQNPHDMKLDLVPFHNQTQPEFALSDHAGILTHFSY